MSVLEKSDQVLDGDGSSVTGSPLVTDAVAHLDCELDQQHLAGDHWIVVGRVRHLAFHSEAAEPLVFCRGGLGRHQLLG